MGKAVTRGLIHKEEVNEMLHSVLFRGLRTSLKALSGHKFDAIQEFNTLRIALRQIEKTMSYDNQSARHTQLKQQ
jgi:hypothetical protein